MFLVLPRLFLLSRVLAIIYLLVSNTNTHHWYKTNGLHLVVVFRFAVWKDAEPSWQ